MANQVQPEDIADDLLYRTGKAIMSGDFEAFLCCFRLPNIVESLEGKRLVESPEEMRLLFNGVRQNFQDKGVADLARTIISAEFLAADVVGSTHVSVQLQKDGTPFSAPYPVYSVLRRERESWKIESSIYVMVDEHQLSKMLIDQSYRPANVMLDKKSPDS